MAPVSQTAPLRQEHRLATGMNACTDFDMLGVADAAFYLRAAQVCLRWHK